MNSRFSGFTLLAVCLIAPLCAMAQVPGEDPIVLNKKINIQMMPLNQNRASGYINHDLGIPAWQQAKIARYSAKAYSADTSGVFTEKDVVHSVKTQGGKVVCSQSVGSTAIKEANGKITQKGDQIVVLRGDLVNVCF